MCGAFSSKRKGLPSLRSEAAIARPAALAPTMTVSSIGRPSLLRLLRDREEHRATDRIHRPIGADGRRSVGLVNSARQVNTLGEGVVAEVPAIKEAIFAVDQHRLRQQVH